MPETPNLPAVDDAIEGVIVPAPEQDGRGGSTGLWQTIAADWVCLHHLLPPVVVHLSWEE